MRLKDCVKLFVTLTNLSISSTAFCNSALSPTQQALLHQIRKVHRLTAAQQQKVKQIFQASRFITQGSPYTTHHPISKQECRLRRKKAQAPNFESLQSLCGHKNMVPVATQDKFMADGGVCIDQYEFPNIVCEYPLVWVRAHEAAQLCEALGKRLCDTHEWEQACAAPEGDTQPLYSYRKPGESLRSWHKRQRKQHNHRRKKVWATRTSSNTSLCGFNSSKSPECDLAISGKGGSVWKKCGSNTFPAGSHPQCHSPRGTYDQHGNAAEHMNLPSREHERTSQQGSGYTEMKGSWFVFGKIHAHPDDCYWRAPGWHLSKVSDPQSHHNYHLSFRCCADVSPPKP
ncbi:MAG: hypothetical protein OXT67_05735 [Zetaproteobacteria bacterium]|nr:hypothetical protein [Zetaproteobacteria bacterium]